jgi:cytochrome b involved in lipid metabolism
MNQKGIIGIIAVIIIVVGGIFLLKKPAEAPSQPQTVTETPAETPAPTAAKEYTLAEVATHKNQTSCWSAINGKVYDLTSWIAEHPGGEGAILGICGKDGSAAFNGQHGGQQKQADVLATFMIGNLK